MIINISKFSLLLLSCSLLVAQTNYEPVSSSVYTFLERMSGKGLIQLNEEIKPFSRQYLARRIQNLELKIQNEKEANIKISKIEHEELEFYIREFAAELKKLEFDLLEYESHHKLIDLGYDNLGFDKFNRFRLYSYESDQFGIFADPILSYEYHSVEEGNWWSYSNGIKLHGYLGNNVGFDLQFYDNHPRGDGIDFDRIFTPETGYEFDVVKGDGLDYDRLNANLNFSWEFITLSLSKDFNYYGSGEDGKLILSDKAPSFPSLKIEVYPTDWLKFSYIHGSLHSQVLDSSTFRFSPHRNHISTVEKYFVSHMLSITPYTFLNFSFGESVIYSDKFEPIYLIPIAFFRFADHYLTDPDENAGNAQLFGSFWYKNYWLKTKFYGSIFIDELTTYEEDYPEAVGYNIGLKSIDPLIPESELVVEYTRINPFVYFHADSAQTYWNYGYEMGHWIGSNADEIFVSFRKRILRGLNLDFWYRYIRKGSEEDFEEPRYQSTQNFLWGDKTYYKFYGIKAAYEITHGFFATLLYENANIQSDHNSSSKNSNFTFTLKYGI